MNMLTWMTQYVGDGYIDHSSLSIRAAVSINIQSSYQVMFNLLLLSICCLTTKVRIVEAFNLPKQQLQRANYHTISTTTQLSSSSSIEEEQTATTSFDDIASHKETNPSAGADGYSILRRPVTVSYFLCAYHMIIYF